MTVSFPVKETVSTGNFWLHAAGPFMSESFTRVEYFLDG